MALQDLKKAYEISPNDPVISKLVSSLVLIHMSAQTVFPSEKGSWGAKKERLTNVWRIIWSRINLQTRRIFRKRVWKFYTPGELSSLSRVNDSWWCSHTDSGYGDDCENSVSWWKDCRESRIRRKGEIVKKRDWGISRIFCLKETKWRLVKHWLFKSHSWNYRDSIENGVRFDGSSVFSSFDIIFIWIE